MSELTGRLSTSHPLVQGPFGGGLSTAKLAAAVTNLGGLGSYGAHILDPEGILRVASEIRLGPAGGRSGAAKPLRTSSIAAPRT